MGSTHMACIGLGMKSPVIRIVVFVLTFFTHLEMFHGCVLAIIGNVINNGISGTTVCTVNERIFVASIIRIKELVETVFTN